MPTSPEGIHYLDDGRELLAILRNWGGVQQIHYPGPAQLFRGPGGQSLYASQQAFDSIRDQLKQDGLTG
jgi:hypothetical protein